MKVVKRPNRKVGGSSAKRGPLTMRLATTGRFVEPGSGSAEIALAPGVFGDIMTQKSAARGLLTGFGKAVRRAEQSGRAVRLTVVIEPGRGTPRIAVEDLAEAPADDLDEALREAKVRGAKRAAEILVAPDMLSGDQFAAAIGATRETVHQKRRRREVLGLEGAKRGVRFPEWQVGADGGLLPGLPALFEALGDRPWAVYRFLLQHHPELDGATGLDALRRSEVDRVLATAQNIGAGVFA